MTYIPDPTYNPDDNSKRTKVTNPRLPPVTQSLKDETDLAVQVHYLPSEEGMPISYDDFVSFLGQLIDADGTIEMSFEVTNDEDLVTGVWQSVYGRDDLNHVDANLWYITNGTLDFAISFNFINYDHIRVKIDIQDSATNTIIVKSRKKSLS